MSISAKCIKTINQKQRNQCMFVSNTLCVLATQNYITALMDVLKKHRIVRKNFTNEITDISQLYQLRVFFNILSHTFFHIIITLLFISSMYFIDSINYMRDLVHEVKDVIYMRVSLKDLHIHMPGPSLLHLPDQPIIVNYTCTLKTFKKI